MMELNEIPRQEENTGESIEIPIFNKDDFDWFSFQGEGGFGLVCKAVKKIDPDETIAYKKSLEGQTVAIKRFTEGPLATERYIETYRKLISHKLNHENVSSILGIIELDTTKESPRKGVVLEFSDCSDLHKLLYQYVKDDKRRGISVLEPDPVYTINHAISWLLQAAKGLEYLHSKDLLHRDFKPANLLMSNGYLNVKLCDVDLVKDIGALNSFTNNRGTPYFQSPEIQAKSNHSGKEPFRYNEKCDVFSYGVTLWCVLSRKTPTQHVPMTRWRGSVNPSPILVDCPKALHRLMTGCWQFDPEKRLGMSKIVEFLTKLNADINRVPPPRIMSKVTESQLKELNQLDRKLRTLKETKLILQQLREKLEVTRNAHQEVHPSAKPFSDFLSRENN